MVVQVRARWSNRLVVWLASNASWQAGSSGETNRRAEARRAKPRGQPVADAGTSPSIMAYSLTQYK